MDDSRSHRLYEILGQRLREARKPISQEAVAQHLQVSRSSIANFECGRQRLPLHSIYAYAEFVNVPIEDLFPSHEELERPATRDDIIEFEWEGRSHRLTKQSAAFVTTVLDELEGEAS